MSQTEKNVPEETFKILEKYDTIIAYSNDNDIPDKFMKDAEANYVTVDLTNEILRNTFLQTYKIEKLPCIITANVAVYDDENYEENIKKAKESMYLMTVDKINELLAPHDNFIFIKGTPTRPECGFTGQLISLLREFGLENGKDYDYLNIFEHENIRQALKKMNRWNTFPQVYIMREFCGGLDVLQDMKLNGSLQTLIDSYHKKNNKQ
ncbi:glutaredoxin [Binucleata daphniae]